MIQIILPMIKRWHLLDSLFLCSNLFDANVLKNKFFSLDFIILFSHNNDVRALQHCCFQHMTGYKRPCVGMEESVSFFISMNK